MRKILVITILSIILLTLPINNIIADSNTTAPIEITEKAIANKKEGLIRIAKASASNTTKSTDRIKSVDDRRMSNLEDFEEPHGSIADPLEPVNRLFFHFNDKLYFWVLKPAAQGYKTVGPEPARKSVNNFFKNLSFPVRFVNCILQGKFKGSGYEFGRFTINSTIGLAGFMDPATNRFEMKAYNEDLGQTLGSYGIGHGFFINWPVLGASSITDTIGTVGDGFLSPFRYLGMKTMYNIAIKATATINKTSLVIGEYEDLKKAALDPYIVYRDAYCQHRQNQINK